MTETINQEEGDMGQVTIIRPTVDDQGHMAEVMTIPPASSVAQRSLDNLSKIIEKAVNSDTVPIERLERLFAMQMDLMDRHAKVLFDTNLAAMQAKLPSVNQTGKLVIREKGNPSKIIQETPFSTMADINDTIRPILAEYGFALLFTSDNLEDGRVRINGILKHAAGHEERTSWVLPQDTSGSKNAVQAFGSSQTYGRRYCTFALLNISSRLKQDMDDDGAASGAADYTVQAGGPPATITDEQVQTLNFEMQQAGVRLEAFQQAFGITMIPDLPASRYEEALKRLKEKKKRNEELAKKKAEEAAHA